MIKLDNDNGNITYNHELYVADINTNDNAWNVS